MKYSLIIKNPDKNTERNAKNFKKLKLMMYIAIVFAALSFLLE
jgi:hypothetical protein